MGKHKNTTQDAIMLRFMQNNPDMAKGFAKGDRVKLEELWKDLTVQLNSNGPPTKDTSGWNKVWMDWKALVRRKIAHNSSEARATGGGPFNKFVLTKMEEPVGELCGIFTVIKGDENAQVFGDSPTEEEIVVDLSDMLEENVASTSKSTTTATPRRHKDDSFNDIMKNVASTSKSTTTATPRRHKDDSFNDIMKNCMRGQTDAMVLIAEQLKEICNHNEHIKHIKDLNREIRNNTHELKAIKKSFQNHIEEKKRHYLRMEQLREEEIQIKRRKLEIEEFKLNYQRGNM